jgi:hypothetical protein
VILVREIMGLRPVELASVIVDQLDILEPHSRTGAIAAITATGIRLRPLPLR